jgi:uncharacterized protein YdiU (UPF0061 family)
MRVGFIHGVMNTDNMSISGETIDYGPCAFMNRYDPSTVFSSVDTTGRYAFGNQPGIAHWNLGCLASTLLAAIDPDQEKAIEMAKELLSGFPKMFDDAWHQMMANKIGFIESDYKIKRLILSLLDVMKKEQGDYTNVFSYLIDVPVPEDEIYQSSLFTNWIADWKTEINEKNISKTDLIQVMQKANPVYIPRNYLVEEALQNFAYKKDDSLFQTLLSLMNEPYKFREEHSIFQNPPANGDLTYKTFCNT